MKERQYARAVEAAIIGVETRYAKLDPLSSEAEKQVAPPGSENVYAPDLPQQHAESEPGYGPGFGHGTTTWILVAAALLTAILGGVFGIVRYQRFKPRRCPKDQSLMKLLDETEDNIALDKGQVLEEKLKSVNYDVWQCPTCPARLVIARASWYSGYSDCGKCHRRTLTSDTTTVESATQFSEGLEETETKCFYCGYAHTSRHRTPRLPPPAPHGSSSTTSFGGGSGGSSSPSRSFGGSGSTAGGGGGSSY
jgi:uncharacterized protein